MAIRDLAISRGASTLIFDPTIIQESSEYNTRDMNSESTIAHIREMADAIIENGNELFPPITIFQEGDDLYVMAGWCRRRAHILAMEEGAPIKGILCLSSTKKRPEELTLNILNSNDGLPLTALEKGKAVKKLQSFMWSPSDIAKKTGWSISTVNNLILLYDAPDTIKEMVQSGKVAATLAINLVRENGPEKALKMLLEAVDTSTKEGKKKATRGNVERKPVTKVNWKKYGPKLYELMNSIYETPANNRDGLYGLIAQSGDLLVEIADKMQGVEGEE